MLAEALSTGPSTSCTLSSVAQRSLEVYENRGTPKIDPLRVGFPYNPYPQQGALI